MLRSLLRWPFQLANGRRSSNFVARTTMPTASLPPHHQPDGKFISPWSTWQDKSAFEAISYFAVEMIRNRDAWKPRLEGNAKPSAEDFAAAFPLNSLDFAALHAPPSDAIQAVWLGHACVLVQMGGATFLTDPVFAERCSPFKNFGGAKRLVAAPVEIEDPQLPNIDFVLVSHNHYDHLCNSTTERIHARFPSCAWYVPLRLGAWFRDKGIQDVVELDWWSEAVHERSKLRIALTPSQHWSARGLSDRRKSLWGGFAVRSKQHSFWFAGDTGYCPVFPEIGEKYGPFDLAAIPIGAYEPRSFMTAQHCNPAEAIRIHKEVRSTTSIGIHCCTWALTTEPLDEPPRELKAQAKAAGLRDDEFVVLQHGARIVASDGALANKPALL